MNRAISETFRFDCWTNNGAGKTGAGNLGHSVPRVVFQTGYQSVSRFVECVLIVLILYSCCCH